MTKTESDLRTRAHRLLAWYPKEWRARYGDEFVELLLSEMLECPRSFGRALNVARNGTVARCAAAGLGGQPLDHEDGPRRSLVAIGAALSIFVVFGLAIWSQLTIGWQWSEPNTTATSSAMLVMSLAIVLFAALCFAAVVPFAWAVLRGSVRDGSGRLLRPLLLTVAGLGVLVVGTHHFANGWPGTGGHPWAHQGVVPGGVAAYAWASTLFVTSYWVHPAALSTFPTPEVAWMVVSPVALAAALVGVAKLTRRLEFARGLFRYERRLAYAASVVMAAFFTGAGLWVFDGGPGPRNLFHIGAIDIVDLVALAGAMAVTGMAVRSVSLDARRFSTR
jgi:hypothetical protein